MQMFSLLQIDAFALAILALIYLNIRRSGGRYLMEQKFYLALIAADALVLLLDMAMWLVDGRAGPVYRVLNLAVTAAYYTMNPLICMLWLLYVYYEIYKSTQHLRRMLPLLLAPACANAILSVFSIHTGQMFLVDAGNRYSRGPLFVVMALICLVYLLYSLALIVLRRRRLASQHFIPMLFFAVLPLVGGVVQSLLYGISLIWSCATFSALVIFINIQNNLLYTDPLTGLSNRRQVDNYLRHRSQYAGGKRLAGMMIDLNAFKTINDRYGHDVGDQALRDTADILRHTFHGDDFVSRYGGDEFLVLLSVPNGETLESIVRRLHDNVEQFNASRTAPYAISLSVGYDCCTGDEEGDLAGFVKHIDELMYREKLKYNEGRLDPVRDAGPSSSF